MAYCTLVAISVFTSNPEDLDLNFLLSILSIVVFGILVTHGQRALFIRAGWLDEKLPPLIPRLLLSSFISSIILTFIFVLFDLWVLDERGEESLEFSRILINVFSLWVLLLFWNAIYFTYHFFQKSRNQEIANLELVASNREGELKNLRSQLNPHFLFNSLNSIRALVDIEPAKAKKSITTLSSLLRQSLQYGRENLVTMEQEVGLAKSYLELEKIRFEERLNVVWELDHSLDQFQIPPFSLQMLVENAIKHGISELKDGGVVRVNTYKNSKGINIRVENSGTLKHVSDLGVGIQNIKRRLQLQFGAGAGFEITEKDGLVIAEISFSHEGV
ncbi:MAG: sensor histidine kinase [Crocinitomicaceae bacterium]